MTSRQDPDAGASNRALCAGNASRCRPRSARPGAPNPVSPSTYARVRLGSNVATTITPTAISPSAQPYAVRPPRIAAADDRPLAAST
jgi:hypothetical protein